MIFARDRDVKGHKTKSNKKGGCELTEGSRVRQLAEEEQERRSQQAVQV
jgi:hypothetical protein